MRSTRIRCCLVIMLLLFSVAYVSVFESASRIKSQKGIDPFLMITDQHPTDRPSWMVAALVTSPSPITSSQRMRLDSLGVVTGSMGRVATMQLSLDAFEEAASLDFVSGVLKSRSFHPALDESTFDIGATFVRQNVTDSLGRPVDGSGVIVGIIDTGVDLSHPDLRFPNGTSKVVSLWDQTGSGKPPQGFTYGVECSWSEINARKCSEMDTFGHGTHVAAIAVSSGLASGRYRGVAPGASLLVVKSGAPLCDGESWTFDEIAIIDGLRYLVEKASELNMRLVVSLSMGGNLGGHDDSSPLELVLDYLNEQDVVVVVSAGNEADNEGHATGSLSQTGSTKVNWQLLGEASSATVDLWYPSDRDVSATLLTPSGQEVRGPTSPDGTRTQDALVTIASLATTKGKELMVSVQRQGGLEASGWSVVLDLVDDGLPLVWDAWVDSDSCSFPGISFSLGEGYTINPNGTVSVPATSRGAIAVGAYVTKNSWVSKLGKNVGAEGYHIGEIAPFSSRGPTRDGRTKPDISAPGLFIAAARSVDVSPSSNDPDQYHRALAGTSMAAPHVAGVVALMLQYNPSLTSESVRTILTEGANLDDYTGLIEESSGSNEWGWGKADARTATAFFRVSSFLGSLPSEFAVALTVNGEPQGFLKGSEVLTLRFPSPDAHTFEVASQSFTANSTRYQVAGGQATYSSNGIFEPNVRVQYLLSLESSLGSAEGEGWYEAGSYADPTVTPLQTSVGFGNLLGISFIFDHWVDEHGNNLPSGVLLMDSPHSLRAQWRATVADWQLVLVVATPVAMLILFYELRSRRLRTQPSKAHANAVFLSNASPVASVTRDFSDLQH